MASKRQLKAAGIVVNPYRKTNSPGVDYKKNDPKSNQAKPNYNPETLTRQQVRLMLRAKARKDLMENYGYMGKGNKRFMGYREFSRRGRRRVQMAITHRWYKQIIAEQQKYAETSRARGWITSLIHKVTGQAPANTLAASGMGR